MSLLKVNFLFFLLIISIFFQVSALAVDRPYSSPIVLVEVSPSELAIQERDNLLSGKELIQESTHANWYETVRRRGAQEIILKQSSGFVGLYTPGGALVREVKLAQYSPTNYYQPGPPIQPAVTTTYKNWDQLGYNTGGRNDPYMPQTVYQKNQQALAAGWGYNSRYRSDRNRTNAVLNFLNFVPLDTVTPLNYPGTFDSSSTSLAYGLGVIPHVGGLFAEMKRAGDNQKRYAQYQTQVPYYSEYPIQYYNPSDPTNPMSRDPNLYRMEQMPGAPVP